MKKSENDSIVNIWEDAVSEKEVIEKFGLSRSTLQRYRREGKLKRWATVNGRRFTYSKSELVEYMNLKQLATA